MFKYDFMRTAFFVGGLLALVLPLIGTNLVLKRMSMIGDALSHVALSGVALGLILGINPLLVAVVLSLLSSLMIIFIDKRLAAYSEISIAVVMSLGIGLTGVLLGFIHNAQNFNAYLFGSVVAIRPEDNIISILLSFVILFISLYYYRELMFVAMDEKGARLSGIKVDFFNGLLLFLTAMTVAIASRIVGALVVSSLLVLPVTVAMQFAKSYRDLVFKSMLFSILFMFLGLTLSFYLDLRPGGTIVLTAVFAYLLSLFINFKKH